MGPIATCPYTEPDQSSHAPHPTSWGSILMSESSKLSPSLRFPHQNPVCTSPLPHMCYMACPSNSSRFDPRIFGEEYISLSSSLCSFLHSPVTLSLLGSNTLLITLFSNTLSLCSSLNVSNQVLHPYKTTGKI